MTFYIYALLILFSQQLSARDIWTPEQAWAWFNAQKPYIMGTELTVSSAANQLEMWQAETFDADLIEKEISYGSKLGFTVFRIFLHDLVYFKDPTGFKSRMNTVLNSLDKYGMKALFVFFDTENPDTNPTLGQQPKPLPAKCDSGKHLFYGCRNLGGSSGAELMLKIVLNFSLPMQNLWDLVGS